MFPLKTILPATCGLPDDDKYGDNENCVIQTLLFSKFPSSNGKPPFLNGDI